VDKSLPGPFLSGEYVAYFLPRILAFSIVILAEHGEELFEPFAVPSTKMESCHKVVPGLSLGRKGVADCFARLLPLRRIIRAQGD
jgi:hypothetical protein